MNGTRQYASGQKPNAMALKKQFNTIKYREFPWIKEIHRDAHAQPFAYLAKAWNRFFADIKAGKPANEPRFKKKGRCRDSFYVANDKFTLSKESVRLPKIGEVAMMEALRFDGKVLGATISRTADRWLSRYKWKYLTTKPAADVSVMVSKELTLD